MHVPRTDNSSYSPESQVSPSYVVSDSFLKKAEATGMPSSSDSVSLPCLYSNNSIDTSHDTPEQVIQNLSNVLSSYHKKTAQTLYLNTERLVQLSGGVQNLAFITLTFPDNVTDPKEAYNRFRSLNTNYLSKLPWWGHWISVRERQKRGAWHFHLIVGVGTDIRSGVDFDEFEKKRYRSASPFLRNIWQDFRENLPKYGFGRSEILPIKSNSEALGRYVGKYISKHIGSREKSEKGVRLVNYSRGWSKNSPKFQWYTENSKLWREKVSIFAKYCGCDELYQLSEKLGSDWAYRYCDTIINAYDLQHEMLTNGGVVCPDHEPPELKRIRKNFKNNYYKRLTFTKHGPESRKPKKVKHERRIEKERQRKEIYEDLKFYMEELEWLKTLTPAPF